MGHNYEIGVFPLFNWWRVSHWNIILYFKYTSDKME
jgi:hypothetical protein